MATAAILSTNTSYQVSQSLYNTVKRILASPDFVKCVCQDGETVYTTDIEVLLCSLEIEHPVCELIIKALQSHKHRYGTGTKTLLFALTRLIAAIYYLQEMGISQDRSVAFLSEALDQLLKITNKFRQPLKLNVPQNTDEPTQNKTSVNCDESKGTTQCSETNIAMLSEQEIDRLYVKSEDSLPRRKSNNVSRSEAGGIMAMPSENNPAKSFHHKKKEPLSNFVEEQNSESLETEYVISRDFTHQQKEDFLLLHSKCVWKYCDSSNSQELIKELKTFFELKDISKASNDHSSSCTVQSKDKTYVRTCSQSDTIPETDIVHLKMNGITDNIEEEDDDIDWFFTPMEPPASTFEAENLKSADVNHSLNTKPLDDSDGVDSPTINISSFKDGDQYDSDFEDCFDDVDNRKHSSVVVEPIPFSHVVPVTGVAPNINWNRSEEVLRRNVQQHFLSRKDFEEAPSLIDSNYVKAEETDEFDTDFSDNHCFNSSDLECTKKNGTVKIKSIQSSQNKVNRTTTEEIAGLNSLLAMAGVKSEKKMSPLSRHCRHFTSESDSEDKVDIESHSTVNETGAEIRVCQKLSKINDKITSSENFTVEQSTTQSSNLVEEKDNANSKLDKKQSVEEKLTALNKLLSEKSANFKSSLASATLSTSRHFYKETKAKQTSSTSDQPHFSNSQCQEPESVIESHCFIPSIAKNSTLCDTPISMNKGSEHINSLINLSPLNSKVNFHPQASTDSGNNSAQVALDVEPCVSSYREKCFESWENEFYKLNHDPVMEVVFAAFQNQNTEKDTFGFNIKLIDCVSESSRSLPTYLSMTEGLVLPCTSDVLEVLAKEQQKTWKTVLLNGDLTPSYHHQGYKPTLAKKTLISFDSQPEKMSHEVKWAHQVLHCLKQNEVTMVLTKGKVSEALQSFLNEAHILFISNVSYHSLSALAHLMRVGLLTYVTDINQDYICCLELAPLSSSWMERPNKGFIVVQNTTQIQTIIINASTEMSAQLIEERLWKCLHCVANAIQDGCVLPGGGVLEESWADKVDMMALEALENQAYLKHVVLEQLADVFRDFSFTVKHNLEAQGLGCSREADDKKSNTSHNISRMKTSENLSFTEPLIFSLSHESKTSKDGSVDLGKHPSHLCDFSLEVEKQSTVQPSLSLNSSNCKGSVFADCEVNCGKYSCLSGSGVDESVVNTDCVKFDCFNAKISAWRDALDVASVIVNLDSLIVTGVEQKKSEEFIF